MFKKIVGYIIALVSVFLVSLFNMNYELMFISGFMIVVPLLDIVFIKQSARHMKVYVDVRNTMVKKGEPIAIFARVDNKGILPVVMMEFDFKCENMLHGLFRDIKLKLPILRWGKQECIFKLKSIYCGDLVLTLERVRCLDYFGIVNTNIKKNFKKKIFVLPSEDNIDLLKVDQYKIADVEGVEFSKIKPGDDPSEVFDIREYRPGDKLHSIHWKLSTRKLGYMVKEFSLPINSNYSIIMDLTTSRKDSQREIDAVIEATMDVILQLQENGINHQVIAYERSGRSVYKEIIEADDSIVDIMYKLYLSGVQPKRNLLLDYDMYNSVKDESNIIYICSHVNKEIIEALDSMYINASKTFLYMTTEEDENFIQKINSVNEVQVISLNIDDISESTVAIEV